MIIRVFAWGFLSSAWLVFCSNAFGQSHWEYGGFIQESVRVYARKPNPSDTHGESLEQFQLWFRAAANERFSWRGALDFQLDTHGDVDRRRLFDLSERGLRRPAGSLSEFYFDAKLSHVDLRIGKQRIRWGRADGFNPTDNVIPYDYLDTFSDERLAIPAAKADVYWAQSNLELVWAPFYTPTRLPLLGQRWFPRLPAHAQITGNAESVSVDLSYRDIGGPFPARTLGNGQWGARYNQILPGAEFSFSYFDGFDDMPFFRSDVSPFSESASGPLQALVSLRREYYRVRVAGLDFASEIGPLGVRGEAAYFDQSDPGNLDHLLFIIGVDRSWGDWSAILQYAGQKINGRTAGAMIFPDLGLRSTMICRIERALGTSRSLEINSALRLRDGDFLLQPTYTEALSNKWKIKIGATLFAGPLDSYLGQFRDNGNINLQLIYAF